MKPYQGRLCQEGWCGFSQWTGPPRACGSLVGHVGVNSWVSCSYENYYAVNETAKGDNPDKLISLSGKQKAVIMEN